MVKAPVELPKVVVDPAPVEYVWVPDAPVPSVVLPEEVRVVNAPVDGVEAPMVVLFIDPPVMVTPEETKVLAVRVPVTVKALLTVVVPVPAPILKVVAAPPKFKVVAVVLSRSKEADGVVREVVIAGEVVARVPLTVVVTPDLPTPTEVALVPPTFKAPAESRARVPDVAV